MGTETVMGFSGDRFESCPDYLKIKDMELILFAIIGCLLGCLVLVGVLNHQFRSRHSEDIQELTKQSEERLEKSKKYGEELDRMLDEMKK
jgi:hypothetical protein